MYNDRVIVFDTTCRDGAQAPGNAHDPADTVRIAKQAVRLGIDVFEAGFAAASDRDAEAVARVAAAVSELTVCSLARATTADIDAAARALERATKPRIHTFIATSDIHLADKLQCSRAEALERAVTAVTYARQYVDDVQFSAEDATRNDPDFLIEMVRAVVAAGAKTVNLPDTVGYAWPHELNELVRTVVHEVPEIERGEVTLSVHCHNDLGLATANSLAGLTAGARQVECTINGIGERAGNAHLAEVVMALSTRPQCHALTHRITTSELGPAARLVASIINKPIPDTLPVVGGNAFAHGSGIHQHGVGANPLAYEVMDPVQVGWVAERFPLTVHSGRHGLRHRLEVLGYNVAPELESVIMTSFKSLAATTRVVDNSELHQLAKQHGLQQKEAT